MIPGTSPLPELLLGKEDEQLHNKNVARFETKLA